MATLKNIIIFGMDNNDAVLFPDEVRDLCQEVGLKVFKIADVLKQGQQA